MEECRTTSVVSKKKVGRQILSAGCVNAQKINLVLASDNVDTSQSPTKNESLTYTIYPTINVTMVSFPVRIDNQDSESSTRLGRAWAFLTHFFRSSMSHPCLVSQNLSFSVLLSKCCSETLPSTDLSGGKLNLWGLSLNDSICIHDSRGTFLIPASAACRPREKA